MLLIKSTAATYYYRHRFSMKKDDTFPEIQTYLYEQFIGINRDAQNC